VPLSARSDHRHGSSVGEAFAGDRLGFLEGRFGEVYTDGPGQPPLSTRLMAGLAILKHAYDLSDEVLCERWVENPYYQVFCGEAFFQHRPPFDRSSLTRWRSRMGEERLTALLQESLSVGSNDLTQLTLGVDRDSDELANLFDEQDEAIKWMIRTVIEAAHRSGAKVGLCGQAPSDIDGFMVMVKIVVMAKIASVWLLVVACQSVPAIGA
jgi:hypothetical protein